jgi:hypothetical protein
MEVMRCVSYQKCHVPFKFPSFLHPMNSLTHSDSHWEFHHQNEQHTWKAMGPCWSSCLWQAPESWRPLADFQLNQDPRGEHGSTSAPWESTSVYCLLNKHYLLLCFPHLVFSWRLATSPPIQQTKSHILKVCPFISKVSAESLPSLLSLASGSDPHPPHSGPL